jgi:hypothetical protein
MELARLPRVGIVNGEIAVQRGIGRAVISVLIPASPLDLLCVLNAAEAEGPRAVVAGRHQQ